MLTDAAGIFHFRDGVRANKLRGLNEICLLSFITKQLHTHTKINLFKKNENKKDWHSMDVLLYLDCWITNAKMYYM